MVLPITIRPSFPLSQSLPLRSFHKFLILIHQRADRMKTTVTENQSNWSHGPQPCLTQWNYEPCYVGPPKTDRSWWRVLTKHGPLEKGMANHFSILALRTPWTVWKGKKIGRWKMNSPGWLVPNMLLEISGEITPERMKRWSQSKNNTQLWMWLMMEVKSDAIKNNMHRNLECSGHESKSIGSGQTGNGKSEHWHFKNQRTKMDWSGWI